MTRNEIVAEAREWKGTKWQHQASLKGEAADCVGMVRGVYRELTGIDTPIDINYPATWHLFKDRPLLYEVVSLHATEIPLEDIKPGDILTFSFRERFTDHHIGIYTDADTFVHAYMDVNKVVETRLDDIWKARLRHAFRFPGVTD